MWAVSYRWYSPQSKPRPWVRIWLSFASHRIVEIPKAWRTPLSNRPLENPRFGHCTEWNQCRPLGPTLVWLASPKKCFVGPRGPGDHRAYYSQFWGLRICLLMPLQGTLLSFSRLFFLHFSYSLDWIIESDAKFASLCFRHTPHGDNSVWKSPKKSHLKLNKLNLTSLRCLKIAEKVSLNIASEASYVSSCEIHHNFGHFWMPKLKWDIFGDF